MLESLIEKTFPSGLTYNSAAQLCLRLYCSTEDLPCEYHEECSKDGLAEVFAKLAAKEFIKTTEYEAALYGANYHSIKDKGHWVEVIASIFKSGGVIDKDLGEKLASQLTCA